jgi:UDP-galactopyranose mutase
VKSALIVGAGFYGAVMARTLTGAGWHCLVVERQSHVGGHCHTEFVPEVGCHRHVYGPHFFHTASPEIWAYAQRFARFNHFVNRPKVSHIWHVAGGPRSGCARRFGVGQAWRCFLCCGGVLGG